MPATRYILGIETSNPSSWEAGAPMPGVAVAREEAGVLRVLAAEAVDPAGKHDDGLMIAIDRMMRGVNLRPRDLACVAVSVGPGGYTAVRVAVTTGKMIAEATGAECKGVPSARVAAMRVAAAGPFAVAVASKGDSAWVTVFDAARHEIETGRLMTTESLPRVGLLVADRFLPEPIRAAARAAGMEVRSPIFEAAACIEASMGVKTVDPAVLAPIYPREAEAVRKWRELHGEKG